MIRLYFNFYVMVILGLSSFYFSFSLSHSPSKAQTQNPPQKVEQKQAKPEATNVQIKTVTSKEITKCACHMPAVEAIQKSYVSLEEDEWPAAIKSCTNALTAITTLQKTCKCPEVNDYKNVAQAFLNYAKGGNHLDGEEDPNCELVTKLYTESIKLLEETLPKLKDEKLKENVQNIRDYSKEELEFVKDECSS